MRSASQAALALVVALATGVARAEDPGPDLTGLDITELMQIEVVSVSKRSTSLADTAAAVTILTGDDLRRAGVTTVHDALRLVPGMHVARISGNTWAISARGFNGRAANKMLVLQDGRRLYAPLFSGTTWETIDVRIDDIERIEIVRGPGGTLWGSNAVTGIINIITKSADQTLGSMLALTAGTEERASIAVRHGWRAGPWSQRAWARGFDRDGQAEAGGGDANDHWRSARAGYRLDGVWNGGQSVLVDAQIYDGEGGQHYFNAFPTPPYSAVESGDLAFSGGHALGRWSGFLRSALDSSLQVSYSKTTWGDPRIRESRDTLEADFQSTNALTRSVELVWGTGFRTTRDEASGTFSFDLVPDSETVATYSLFAQLDLAWGGGRGRLHIGSKIEHNDYTGFEVQPSVRASWKTTDAGTFWAALTRAHGEPSRVYDALFANVFVFPDPDTGAPIAFRAIGSNDLAAERVTSCEAGYRHCLGDDACASVSAFYSDFEDNIGAVDRENFIEVRDTGPLIVDPGTFENRDSGTSSGLEVEITTRPSRRWQLSGSYSYIEFDFASTLIPAGILGVYPPVAPPRHQTRLLSRFDLDARTHFDATLLVVDEVPDLPGTSYERLDVRVMRRLGPNLDVELVGQNLLDDRHREFVGFLNVETQVERSAFGRVTWRF